MCIVIIIKAVFPILAFVCCTITILIDYANKLFKRTPTSM